MHTDGKTLHLNSGNLMQQIYFTTVCRQDAFTNTDFKIYIYKYVLKNAESSTYHKF